MSGPRTATVLGATGTVGKATLALIEAAPAGAWRVEVLVAGRDSAALAVAAKRAGASLAVVADPDAGPALEAALSGTGIKAAAGPDAVLAAASITTDWTMAAVVGTAGLAAVLAAVARGGTVAIANKECLVTAGELLVAAAIEGKTILLPVDSEHNAIFQAMDATAPDSVERIVLTCSGGPFRALSLAEMRHVRPEHALKHPIWRMGPKISIDSATMMNKGLEVIEAARLFPIPEPDIGVLIHPEAMIHGFVHYRDGSVLAQMAAPDMRVPIASCLAWPERMVTTLPRLDLLSVGKLTFEAPDLERFPALGIARAALREGGAAPAILNAANEVAVRLFLDGAIAFTSIAALCEAVLARMGARPADSLDALLDADHEARRSARLMASEPVFA